MEKNIQVCDPFTYDIPLTELPDLEEAIEVEFGAVAIPACLAE
ncbi:hypothetical protein ACFXG6_31800 [Streptomyces roseus]